MVDVLGLADVQVPSFGIGTGKIFIILAILLIIIIVAIIIILVHSFRTYNIKIHDFENVAGRGFQLVFKDRARLISLGSGGEELMYLRKRKKYRTAYGRKMGKRNYWFAKGQDGYWYNFLLGDLDAKMGMLDIEPIDRDMRYMHVAIRKNIQDTYKKESWLQKYGLMIGGAVIILIIMIGSWFLLDKMAGIAAANAMASDTAVQVLDATKQVVSILERICSASGVRPA